MSDIPYAQKFGGGQQVDMSLGDYIDEVRAHRMLGGHHPWYVFKGHPIPAQSDAADSLVKYDMCPMPALVRGAFERAAPANSLNNIEAGNPTERLLFVNAQWALGGEGTGAPVCIISLCIDYLLSSHLSLSPSHWRCGPSLSIYRSISTTPPGKLRLSLLSARGVC